MSRPRLPARLGARLACAATIFAFGLAGVAAQQDPPRASGPPPLQVDKAAPLLLDEPAATQPSAPRIHVPKLICYDCHGNYREESLAVAHARQNITCVTCHGASKAHESDESNTTPPEVMYPRERIDDKCQECHPAHNAAPSAVIMRWQQRLLQKLDPKMLVCTDCHGEHRMRVRTVHWNKQTGKLRAEEKSPPKVSLPPPK